VGMTRKTHYDSDDNEDIILGHLSDEEQTDTDQHSINEPDTSTIVEIFMELEDYCQQQGLQLLTDRKVGPFTNLIYSLYNL
jgi:hypothetical protein